ncbi:alpha/beta fold hydrolase [Asticcacaulis sp. SL142]|uniref:alpha/beta fold hydrolase n=1 Tax=Asticcacaulis sp. SL142 TaxID=2995155 RepID=UPI00226CAC1D|nr:alpha/beta fold hydrolase [Asticcacaulis sp. SL142]WAC48268.1 alpha/beta fold hydrolase [Asticcacaulis sp. SL142]
MPFATVAETWNGDGGVTPFYRWEGPIPTKAGTMLRRELASPEASLQQAVRTERILYSSIDWLNPDKPTIVSGMVFFPKGAMPKGGWPIIAWAHGTTGVADVCAPSFLPRSDRDKDYLNAWLEAGFAIVATDYEGLGTPGPHPYLQYKSEAISVLDSLRAAQNAYPNLLRDDQIIIMGQSQGGGAALAAAYLAPSYAPELKIKGTVATGPVAHTQNFGKAHQEPLPGIFADPSDYSNTAFEILYFLGTIRSMDSAGIKAEDYISEAGLPMLRKAQSSCFWDLIGYANEIKLSIPDMYKKDIQALTTQAEKVSAFPDAKIQTPVFTGTGQADVVAQSNFQYNFISAMCVAGTSVEWRYYPNATHSSAVMRSRVDSPAFIEKVLHGKKPQNRCGELVPPGPAQEPEAE